jgi:hypothetical protein
MLSIYGQVYSLVRSSEARFIALAASTDGLPEPVLAAISTASEGAARLHPGFCQGGSPRSRLPTCNKFALLREEYLFEKEAHRRPEAALTLRAIRYGLWLVRPVRIRYREASLGMAVDVYLPIHARFRQVVLKIEQMESSANGSSNLVTIRALPAEGVVLQSLPTSSSPPWKLTMP